MKAGLQTMIDLWRRIEATLEGKPSIDRYLEMYEVETPSKHAYRLKFTSYHGLPAAIQDAKIAVFKRAVISENVGDKLKDYLTDVDMCRTPVAAWRAKEFVELDTYGVSWVLVDMPRVATRPDTEQQRIDMNVRPYFATYSPAWITDWEMDRQKRLTMVVLDLDTKYKYQTKDGKDAVAPLFRKWNGAERKSYEFYVNDQAVEVTVPGSEVILELTWTDMTCKIPWVVRGMKASKTMPGFYVSPNAAISDVAIELFTRASQQNVLFAKSAFGFIAGPKSWTPKSIGDTSYCPCAPGDVAPMWVVPPAALFQPFFDSREQLVSHLFAIARKKNTAIDTGAMAKSGAALTIEANEEEAAVGSIAATVREIEMECWHLAAELLGVFDAAITLDYPETWDVSTYLDDLATLEAISTTRNKALYEHEANRFINRKVADVSKREALVQGFLTGFDEQIFGRA